MTSIYFLVRLEGVCLFVCLLACLFVCRFVALSVCLFVCLFVCLLVFSCRSGFVYYLQFSYIQDVL